MACLPRVKLQRLVPEARIPRRATSGSAYYDVFSAVGIILWPGKTYLVTTGWLIEVPTGWFLDIRPRSGMASKGVTVNNAPGTVDADYRGRLMIILHNHDTVAWSIMVGDRIAQVALMPVVRCEFVERKSLSRTSRGGNGYGSTER